MRPGLPDRNAKDTEMPNLPYHDLTQNRIWLAITTLAADLLAWTQRLALTGPASYKTRRSSNIIRRALCRGGPH